MKYDVQSYIYVQKMFQVIDILELIDIVINVISNGGNIHYKLILRNIILHPCTKKHYLKKKETFKLLIAIPVYYNIFSVCSIEHSKAILVKIRE